jgi:hypothetical protein
VTPRKVKPHATAKPKKPRKQRRDLVPQPHGGALRPGGDGVSGGRPPDEWKATMRRLRDRWLVAAEAEKVLENPAHPAWLQAAKFIHEAVEGKAPQPVDVTSQGKALGGVVLLPPMSK